MSTKKPELVDELVAYRIRAYRKECRMSQMELASQLGVTFQQLQKYEKGTNRISAGRLYALAHIFGVPIQALYPNSDDSFAQAVDLGGAVKQMSDFTLSADGWRLCRAFLQISNAQLRKKIIALVQDVVDAE